MKVERELMRGAGALAVLKLLERSEMYGYELVEALAAHSKGALAMGQSTLYPLLYNLEAKKWVESFERQAPSGRVRRYYRLTRRGGRELARKTAEWRSVNAAMSRLGVLGDSGETGAIA